MSILLNDAEAVSLAMVTGKKPSRKCYIMRYFIREFSPTLTGIPLDIMPLNYTSSYSYSMTLVIRRVISWTLFTYNVLKCIAS